MDKILLVEDNEMHSDMLSRRLEKKGYAVALAADGEQGVVLAKSLLPDLILMDMGLPKMDGWQAARLIKTGAKTWHIPIIALTIHSLAKDRLAAMEAGCDGYETKPVDFPRLLAKIQAFLGNHGQ